MTAKIRIAQVKVFPAKGEMAANHALLMDVLSAIARHKPDVVITPECFLDGYVATEESVSAENIGEYAIDPASSRYTAAVSRWARERGTWLIYGCTRKGGDGIYNSALIFDRSGVQIGCYDKLHLQAHDEKFTPGKLLPVFESEFGTFGVMICADRRWPETVRTLALKSARVIFNPTYGMSCDMNLAMMRTRSYESEIFIIFTHPRQSLITDSTGKVICDNQRDEETFTITQIDVASVEDTRAKCMSHLNDRRCDVYAL